MKETCFLLLLSFASSVVPGTDRTGNTVEIPVVRTRAVEDARIVPVKEMKDQVRHREVWGYCRG